MTLELARAEPCDVLVVDDDDVNLRLIEVVLRPLGQRVHVARSGPEAIDLAQAREVAVILLDMHMPGMNGLDVAAAIKHHGASKHAPILFLTADGESVRDAYELGAVDYLQKPFAAHVLRTKVGVFVELHARGKRIQDQEQRLRQRAEEQLRAVVQNAPLLLFALDRTGHVRVVEGSGADPFGVRGVEARGASFFAPGAARDDHVAHAMRALSGEAHTSVEHAPGEDTTYEVRWVPQTEDGRVRGCVAVATNVTERVRAETELKTAIHVRDEFLSIASHELKTPLTPLKMHVGMLRRRAVTPDDLQKRLEVVDRQVDRLVTLVDQLLDVSRITAGKLKLTPEPVDLVATVRDVVASFREPIERSGSAVTVAVASEAPSVVGTWDAMRVEQVVVNLLANAVKYGRGRPVRIRVHGDATSAVLVVEDEGIGIPREEQQRLFGRFERAVSERHYGGFGLGLWIVRQIVEASGGSVVVESEPDVGSRFTVTLPRGASTPSSSHAT